jgi:hypothetical protein
VIKPNKEMVSAAYDEIDFVNHTWESVEAAVTKVVALIERDYRITCGSANEVDGPNHCVKEPGHAGVHIGLSPSAARVWS